MLQNVNNLQQGQSLRGYIWFSQLNEANLKILSLIII